MLTPSAGASFVARDHIINQKIKTQKSKSTYPRTVGAFLMLVPAFVFYNTGHRSDKIFTNSHSDKLWANIAIQPR